MREDEIRNNDPRQNPNQLLRSPVLDSDFGIASSFVMLARHQICEYVVGTKNRFIIFDTVSSYCGSFLSLFQTGCLPNSPQCFLWASAFSADNMYVKCGKAGPI